MVSNNFISVVDLLLLLLPFFFFCLFGATPTAYGSSQARGQIGAVALAYTTATATPDPSLICDLPTLQLISTLDP